LSIRLCHDENQKVKISREASDEHKSEGVAKKPVVTQPGGGAAPLSTK
jgi:hypothetical protein